MFNILKKQPFRVTAKKTLPKFTNILKHLHMNSQEQAKKVTKNDLFQCDFLKILLTWKQCIQNIFRLQDNFCMAAFLIRNIYSKTFVSLILQSSSIYQKKHIFENFRAFYFTKEFNLSKETYIRKLSCLWFHKVVKFIKRNHIFGNFHVFDFTKESNLSKEIKKLNIKIWRLGLFTNFTIKKSFGTTWTIPSSGRRGRNQPITSTYPIRVGKIYI